jgi:Homeodomain-like domain
MEDVVCRRFFLEPTQTLQRRYEALRAFFVQGASLPTIAERFHLTYHTARSRVRDFRAQCQAGHVPPFFRSRAEDDPQGTTPHKKRRSPKRLRSPTAASCA